MHGATGGGEWITMWLSPVAYFLFDVVFGVVLLAAMDLFLKALRRARRRG
jgi:hypothetical protein